MTPGDRTKQIDKFVKALDGLYEEDDKEKMALIAEFLNIATEFLKGIEEYQEREFAALRSSVNADIDTRTSESGRELSAAQKRGADLLKAELIALVARVEKALREQENGMNYIYDKVRSLKNGKDSDPQEVAGIVLKQITPGMTEEEKQRLEELADDVEAFRKLAEEMKRSRSTIPAVTPVGGRNLVRTVDISDQLDGSTKTFNIGAFHSIQQVVSSSFPHALRATIDYTWDANAGTITFTDEIDASTVLGEGQTVRILTITA